MYWRSFSRTGHLNAGNQGILLIFSVLILARFLQSLHTAAIELPQGKSRVFESLLLGIFLAWMFPLINNTRSNNSIRKLLHLPFSRNELFAIRLVTLFIPPYAWIILGGSLAICYPIFRAENPLTGVIAACLFIVLSALTGLTVSQLMSIGIFRRLLFFVLLLSGLTIFYLVERRGGASGFSLRSVLPSVLVTRAALGNGALVALCELVALTGVACLLALWSFSQSLEITSKPRSKKTTVFGSLRLPGPIGGLAAKDFRYFRRLLDPYLGVLLVALGSLYLITAEVASAGVFQVLLLGVFVCNSSLAFNLFGLDNRAGMDRLRLMPVTANTILLSKNLAFTMVVGVQVVPLILLASWRLGLLLGLFAVIEAAALAAMFLSWGNWMSVNHAFKLHFFQFSSSNGLLVEAIAGIMFGSLPGIVAIYSLRTTGFGPAWQIALIFMVSSCFYCVSFLRAGNRFLQRQETIRNALS
jgi:hypothetical protein